MKRTLSIEQREFLNSYCSQNNLKYFAETNHNNEVPLFLWSNVDSRFIEVSFNIYDLSVERIKNLVDEHIFHHCYAF